MRTRLHDLVLEKVQDAGTAGRTALTYKGESWTYADLASESLGFAEALRALGLAREERVAVYLDKRLHTVAAILGTSAAGGAFVPINPVLRGSQVQFILGDCEVRVLVTSTDRLAAVRDDLADLPALEHVVLVDSTDPPAAAEGAAYALHGWPARVAADAAPVTGIDLDMGAILYTSGSTGMPKGVVLSHRNLLVGAESVSSYIGNRPDDVVLALLPLSFDAGLSQLTTAFAVGAHVVLHNHLLARDVVRLCAEHRVTGLTCVPPLWIQLAEQAWPAEATASLRYFANTGGRMPRTTLDLLREHFPGARPFLMYGLTEAFRSTYLDPSEVDRRPDSIGKAIPDAEILVVGPDGRPCGPGEPGELVHRGALVALGYWNDPQRTAERFRPAPGRASDWRTPELAVWSGDTVVTDEDGFLYFVGRTDDMIKTSGYRVSPTEIEEVAFGTGMVRAAVALGLPDERLGHRVVLVVTPAGEGFDVTELTSAMKRLLPLYMVPANVHVRDRLPTSPNGKFDRVALRAELTS
jgi:acyl-CoA ligase (AMP-forming) (exosortase A-associated)